MTTAQIGDSGIILNGPADDDGVSWGWNSGSDPWQPGATPRDSSGELAFGHGRWNATAFYGERVQEFGVTVKANSHEAMHRARDRWNAALGLAPFRLTIVEPHLTRSSIMRRRGDLPWNELTPGPGLAVAATSVSLVGDDPRIVTDARTVSTTWPTTTGGLQWPATWPATWTATVATGLLSLANEGSQDADVLWRIDGPVSRPRVIDTATGDSFTLLTDLGVGEWITVDTFTGQVLQSGQPGASRRSLWSGKWLRVPPGGRAFAFAGASGQPTASLAATWSATWI